MKSIKSCQNPPSADHFIPITLHIVQAVTMKPKVYQFLVGVFASFGSLLFGYDLGVIAQVIASPSYHREFNTSDTAADT
jgi:hypothetical protein